PGRLLKSRISDVTRRFQRVRTGRGRRLADSIHKLRVAVRRTTAVCHAEWWPASPGSLAKLRKRLKEIRNAAGKVRDFDVLLKLLTDFKVRAGQDSAAKRAILRAWRQERAAALGELRDALTSKLAAKLTRRARKIAAKRDDKG